MGCIKWWYKALQTEVYNWSIDTTLTIATEQHQYKEQPILGKHKYLQRNFVLSSSLYFYCTYSFFKLKYVLK